MEQIATTALKALLGVAVLVLVSAGCVAFLFDNAQKHRMEWELENTSKLLEKAVRPDKPELLTLDQAKGLYEYRRKTAILLMNLTAASRMELEALGGNPQAFNVENGTALIDAELQSLRLASRGELLRHLHKANEMREAKK